MMPVMLHVTCRDLGRFFHMLHAGFMQASVMPTCAMDAYGRPVPFLLVADLLETFSKNCAKELTRRRRDRCFASRCDIY